MVDKYHKFRGMGRRNFIKAVGSLGVSGAALRHMTKETMAKVDPKTEVPRIGWWVHTNHEAVRQGAAPKRKPIYYKISREKWARVETAWDAREKLKSTLNKIAPDCTIGVRTGTEGQQRTKELIVYHPAEGASAVTFDEFRGYVPSTVSGTAGRGSDSSITFDNIPVRVEQAKKIKKDAHYEYEYRPVLAACIFRHSNGGYCTIGSPAYSNRYNEQVLVTAGHCLDESDEEVVYQNNVNSGDIIGDRSSQVYDDNRGDIGVIRLNNGINVDYYAASDYNNSYTRPDIKGAMSSSRLQDLEGTNVEIEKRGCNTGSRQGSILELNEYSFTTDHDRAGGDSGGPYWEVTDIPDGTDSAFVAGIHEGYPSGNSSVAKATRWDKSEQVNNFEI